MYLLKNVSKNQKIVCTLKDGSTLRLLPNTEVKIKDDNMTDYLLSLSKGKMKILRVSHQDEVKVTTTAKAVKNDKKEE